MRRMLLLKFRRCLGWEHNKSRQLIAAEVLARTAKHVLACRFRQACMREEEEERRRRSRGREEDGEEEEVCVCCNGGGGDLWVPWR